MAGISEKMLIQELKEMQLDRIVARKDYREVPPHVTVLWPFLEPDAVDHAVERDLGALFAGVAARFAQDQAALDQAQRDVARYTDLVGRGATPQLNLDNARTAEASSRAAIHSTWISGCPR